MCGAGRGAEGAHTLPFVAQRSARRFIAQPRSPTHAHPVRVLKGGCKVAVGRGRGHDGDISTIVPQVKKALARHLCLQEALQAEKWRDAEVQAQPREERGRGHGF